MTVYWDVNFLRKIVKDRIAFLTSERDAMQREQDIYPAGTFAYQRLEFGIAIWNTKIELLKAVMGKQNIEAAEMQ